MKHLLNLILLFSSVLSALAQAGEKNFIDQNYIEVTGQAEIQITPDLIYIKISITDHDKSKLPVPVAEKRMIDKLQEIGIDVKKDLLVNDLLSLYRYKVFGRDIVTAKEYQLAVHDATAASRVFLELEKLEISNTSIERVDHTKIEEYRKELKINAIKDARDKAESLTKAINQSVGRAIFVSEMNRPINIPELKKFAYDYYSNEHQLMARQQTDYTVNLNFEKIKLEYSILTRFELK